MVERGQYGQKSESKSEENKETENAEAAETEITEENNVSTETALMQTVAGTAEKDSADVKEDTKMQETKAGTTTEETEAETKAVEHQMIQESLPQTASEPDLRAGYCAGKHFGPDGGSGSGRQEDHDAGV